MRSNFWFMGLFVAAFCLYGCLPKAPINEQEKAEMLYLKAANLQGDEEFAKATDEFEAFVGRYPQSNKADNAQLEIGNNYRRQDEYEKAISAYEMVLEKYPDGGVVDQAMLNIGDGYLDMNEREKSVTAYQKLVDKYPYLGNNVAEEAQSRIDVLEELKNAEEIVQFGDTNIRDNAQYHIASIYFHVFQDYPRAIKEFNKVIEDYPDSELADDAMWTIGECYWAQATLVTPPRGETDEQQAYVRIQRITDRYPQLAELDSYDTDGYPHWPAGRRGGKLNRYELYFAEVRRLLSRYPNLKDWQFKNFIAEDYRKALDIWDKLILQYPNTDSAANAPQKMSERLTEVGRLYYVSGMYDFASILFKESLQIWPSPEAHIYLAYYYADSHIYTQWTYSRSRVFQHIKEAEKLVPPGSDLALDLKNLKTWMNYRSRIESLEKTYFNLKNNQ